VNERDECVGALLSVLHYDSTYAKTSALIGWELGWESEAVEGWVERARKQGHPILDNDRGFYLGRAQETAVARQIAGLLSLLGRMI